MTRKNVGSNLFVDLSDEQQELVSGGGQLTGLSDYLNTAYTAEKSLVSLQVIQSSGPSGSTNAQQFSQDFLKVDTSASKNFDSYFN